MVTAWRAAVQVVFTSSRVVFTELYASVQVMFAEWLMCLCTGRVRRVYRAIGVPLIRSCLQGDLCCRVYKFISVSLLRIYRVVGVSLCRSTLMGDGRISMPVYFNG